MWCTEHCNNSFTCQMHQLQTPTILQTQTNCTVYLFTWKAMQKKAHSCTVTRLRKLRRKLISRSKTKVNSIQQNQQKHRLGLINNENTFPPFTLGVWDCTEKGLSGTPADLFLFSTITGGGLSWTVWILKEQRKWLKEKLFSVFFCLG